MSARTSPRMAKLQALRDKGLSYSQCARAMRVSRGAVAGLIHRLNTPSAPAKPRPKKRGPEDQPTRFSVEFDPETFAEMKVFCQRNSITRTEAVRLLVEWGLEAECAE